MDEKVRKYIEEKVLYYGWITETDWAEQIKSYNVLQQPDLLKWLLQRRLLLEEQASFLRQGLQSLSNTSEKDAQTLFEEAIAQPPEMHDTLAGHISSENTPTVDVIQSATVSWEADTSSQSPTMAGTVPPEATKEPSAPAVAPQANVVSSPAGDKTISVDFAKEAAKSPPAPTPVPPAPTTKGFDPAKKRFGPYEILQKLGEGGMGQVYKARHVFLDKMVALKVLAKHLSTNPQFIERFFREAKACGKMDHPNVVRSLDAGEIDGVSYLALEFVDGKPLSKLVHEGEVTQSQAIKYLIGILKALDYAEGLRLVHRDIKPDNIMISDKKIAKLLDMGLTKEVGDTSMTKAGQILGTPDYISPEQARGDIAIDIRADIYSLGATFYHVLTGQKPFPGGGSVLVLLNQHISMPLTPLQQIKPTLDPNICAIIEKMMAKDKNDRFQHPKDIIQEIEQLIQGTKQSAEITHASPTMLSAPMNNPQEVAPTPVGRPVIPGKGRNPDAPIRPSEIDILGSQSSPPTSPPIKEFEPRSGSKENTKLEPKKNLERLSSAKSGPLAPTLNATQASHFKNVPEKKVLPSQKHPKSSSGSSKLLLLILILAVVVAIVFFVFYYNKF